MLVTLFHFANNLHAEQYWGCPFFILKYAGESVEAGRRYVESYVSFIHYVERLYLASSGLVLHHGESKGAVHEEHHGHWLIIFLQNRNLNVSSEADKWRTALRLSPDYNTYSSIMLVYPRRFFVGVIRKMDFRQQPDTSLILPDQFNTSNSSR